MKTQNEMTFSDQNSHHRLPLVVLSRFPVMPPVSYCFVRELQDEEFDFVKKNSRHFTFCCNSSEESHVMFHVFDVFNPSKTNHEGVHQNYEKEVLVYHAVTGKLYIYALTKREVI